MESPTGICSYLQLIWINCVSTFWSCSYPPSHTLPKFNSAGGLQHTYYTYINLPLTHDFASCLDSFGFQQHIDFPTHSKDQILDLVCCSGHIPSNCITDKLLITDHLLQSFNVQLTLSSTKPSRVISFRNIKNINPDALSAAINCLLNTHNPSNPDDLAFHYNNTILNSLAPLKTRSAPSPPLPLGSLLNYDRWKPKVDNLNDCTGKLILLLIKTCTKMTFYFIRTASLKLNSTTTPA